MERYAPTMLDLAPRDMVSRAIYLEIARAGHRRQGLRAPRPDPPRPRGDREKLPDITEFIRVYQGIEPITQPVPIQPTAHYAMGGIPTDVEARVVIDEQNTVVPGCTPPASAPASASTARTGWAPTRCSTSSSSAAAPGARWPPTSPRRRRCPSCRPMPAEPVRAELEAMRAAAAARARRRTSARAADGDDGRSAGVFRTRRRLTEMVLATPARAAGALPKRALSRTRAASSTPTCSRRASWATCSTAPRRRSHSALARTESRGGHFREDYPERDDTNWLRHTLAYRAEGGPRLSPVTHPLQAGDDHEVRTQAGVAPTERHLPMEIAPERAIRSCATCASCASTPDPSADAC
jgi:succinate dehydrogenase / fumarate reductase, flavoprotein subunit